LPRQGSAQDKIPHRDRRQRSLLGMAREQLGSSKITCRRSSRGGARI